jgi:hypothetical protein
MLRTLHAKQNTDRCAMIMYLPFPGTEVSSREVIISIPIKPFYQFSSALD